MVIKEPDRILMIEWFSICMWAQPDTKLPFIFIIVEICDGHPFYSELLLMGEVNYSNMS